MQDVQTDCLNVKIVYVLHFDVPTKLFSDLYLAKFLDTSKPHFPYKIGWIYTCHEKHSACLL